MAEVVPAEIARVCGRGSNPDALRLNRMCSFSCHLGYTVRFPIVETRTCCRHRLERFPHNGSRFLPLFRPPLSWSRDNTMLSLKGGSGSVGVSLRLNVLLRWRGNFFLFLFLVQEWFTTGNQSWKILSFLKDIVVFVIVRMMRLIF